MSDEQQQQAPPQGKPILISFRELSSINNSITEIKAKLDVALTLPIKIQDHEERLVALETERAVQHAKGGVYGKAWEIIFGLVLAIIAAGVWWPHH